MILSGSLPETTASLRSPLTRLADDEQLLFESVLEFASREVAPQVREMDEQAAFPADLVPKLFDLGVMGIEIPERFGE